MFLAQPFSSAGFSAIAPRFGATFLSSPEFTASTAFEVNYLRVRNITLDITNESDVIAFGGYLKTFSPSVEVSVETSALPNAIYRPTVFVNSNATITVNGYLIGEEWSDTTFNAHSWTDVTSGNDSWIEKSVTTNTWNKKG
jgi:hypothetical protein